MSGQATVAWDEALTQYDFGPGHPLAPVRVALTIELARQLGVLSAPSVTMVSPPPATDAELATVHDDDYIAAVRQAGRSLVPDFRFGLGTEDDPVFEGMHEASALVAGATLAAAQAVWSGSARHGASVAGGLHHAMRRAASGFCVYNDLAVAIKWLLAAGAERVVYVDTDVHHGDGVQAAFYDDPRVLTISLHEHPATLFPGTGLPGETGVGAGVGYAVNVALPAGTGDAGWLRAFDAVVPPLLRAFKPLVLVVPRTWTHLLAIVAGIPVDPAMETPVKWRELARSLTGETAPVTMTDGASARYVPFSSGIDPGDPVDRAIMRTRTAVFAGHGLLAHP